MSLPIEILLVSGLHPNEKCAPLMARAVFNELVTRRERVALYEVPYPYTLAALIDEPAIAVTLYSMPAAGHRLDVDLEELDTYLECRYPGALIFEFHNGKDTHPVFGIDPGKPVQDYEVGTIGPRFERPYEIGTWRNVDRDGRPGKYLIELPACYTSVTPSDWERRRRRLEELREAGYVDDPRWLHYFGSEANVEASRRRGYLEDCLVQKAADWILSCRETER